MPLPGDVSVFTLSGGPYTDATGAVVLSGVTGTLVPVDGNGRPTQVVHAADGSVIVPESVPITIASDGTWTVAGLAHTDDAHLTPTGFLYQVTWKVPAYRSTLVNKLIAVPIASGGTVDFDLLANGTTTTGVAINLPVVISVVGATGAVTGTQIAADPAMKAALVPFWAPAETVTAGTVRMDPTGHTITRNANGTTRATYDATEQALWTVVSGGGGGAITSVNGKTGVVVLSASDVGADASGAATAAQAASLQKSSNLSDIASAATARTNLGLGGAAALNVGTTAGTVAAGDDSRFGTGVAQSLYGVKAQPWKPSPALGPELWALANFAVGAGLNSTTLTPSLTAAGALVTLDTRVNLGNLTHRDTAFRFTCNLTSVPTTGWWKLSVLLTDSSGTVLAGTNEQYLSGDQGDSTTGVRLFEFLPNAASVLGSTYLVVRLQVWNNVTAGQVISIGSASLREIAHVTRPMRYAALTSYANQAVMVPLFDPVAGTWRFAVNQFQPDGALTVSFNGADGTFSDQPFTDLIFDPTFTAAPTKRGTPAPLFATGARRPLRINNNDQILSVRRSDGVTFDFRGNTHGGEVNSPAATFAVDLNDGNGWQAWDGTGTVLRPAVRLQCHFPTTMSRPAPDSDQFATVDHLLTYFGNGVIRMDRTTTFTQATVVNQIIEWMSSHDVATPKIGRIGRGLVVIDEADIFPKVAAPALSTVTTATTGGTLAAATYTYAVTALTEGGETTAASGTVTTTGATSTATVPWTTVTGATGYRVYGRTAGRLALLATLGPAATSWTDDGSAAAVAPQPPIVNTARQLGATTYVQDAATSSNGYWGCWYDPVVDMCYANIYDRDATLARSGIIGAKSRLEGGSGIVKSYLNLYWGGSILTIPSGTAWTATHWAYAYIPQDRKNYHLEAALLATDLAALKTNYPAA